MKTYNTRAAARKAINKILAAGTVNENGGHFFDDACWKPVNKMLNDLKDAGFDFTIEKARYVTDCGSGQDFQLPTRKEWHIKVHALGYYNSFLGIITAHGAGTVDDPLSRYDVTAFVF
jgi:hypothetical protein